jgi:hypothetical protein
MPLRDFQTALGRMVLNAHAGDSLCSLHLDATERECLDTLPATPGFRFTREVQRSWCESRAANAAYLTLSILSDASRRAILDEWVRSGGGTASFFGSEAEGLLNFIAQRLPAPSRELNVCRFEQAVIRASIQSSGFRPPALLDKAHEVRRARHASLVMTLLIAPGLMSLHRAVSLQERLLWDRLAAPVAVGTLEAEGFAQDLLEAMLHIGALEYAC